jgi:putative oxidoreductase
MASRLLARTSRALLGSAFIVLGYEAAKDPGEARIRSAARLKLPHPEFMVRANGAAMVAGGVMITSDVARRLGATVLVASMVPTTYAGHAYWQHDDPAVRFANRIHFFKNVSLVGALLAIVVNAPGA